MSGASEQRAHVVRRRVGQTLGLLFLIGPLTDLAHASLAPWRTGAIAAVFAFFVVLYLGLLPPVRALERRGRRWLRGALALLAATGALALALGAPSSFVALFVYFAAAAGLLLPPRAAVAVIAATAGAVAAGLALAGAGDASVASLALTILAIGGMMASFARKVQANRELQAAREELAHAAVAEERLRIARDLHDLLGHTLSVIALKSELAAKLVERDAAQARSELEDIRDVTRQALAEVREAVQGYRRLALPDEVQGARAALAAAGIDCRVDGGEVDVPVDVEDALAWAVREATTNVVRHSDARACAIRLSAHGDRVELAVDDDGSGSASAAAPGTGLTGIAERVQRLRGSVEAGARPEGGFRLRVVVPLPAP